MTIVVGKDVTADDGTDDGDGLAAADAEGANCARPSAGDDGIARAELPIATRTTRAIAIDSKRTSGFAHRLAAIFRKKPSETRAPLFEARVVSEARCESLAIDS